ncbi:MAG: NYN domain-containing protein [Acidobacteriota bacterium]
MRRPVFENGNHDDEDSAPSPPRSMNAAERNIALFIDFENIAIGVREAKYKKFEITLLLERLLEKGKVVVKRAYCDWDKFPDYKRELHEAAIELIEIPGRAYSGKNSADIRMVVDAMDMSWAKEHIDHFVIASGDSDFSPLASKLKENGKFVIGVGVKSSSSDLLIDNCDEFIFYEDLVRGLDKVPAVVGKDKKQAECFKLLIDSIKALMRENKEILWGSMIKQTMQRKKPTFNEEYYGYNTFSDLLEDAQLRNIIKIKRDVKSGTYVITGFAQPSA